MAPKLQRPGLTTWQHSIVGLSISLLAFVQQGCVSPPPPRVVSFDPLSVTNLAIVCRTSDDTVTKTNFANRFVLDAAFREVLFNEKGYRILPRETFQLVIDEVRRTHPDEVNHSAIAAVAAKVTHMLVVTLSIETTSAPGSSRVKANAQIDYQLIGFPREGTIEQRAASAETLYSRAYPGSVSISSREKLLAFIDRFAHTTAQSFPSRIQGVATPTGRRTAHP